VFRKKWVIALIVMILLAAMGGAYFYFKKEDAVSVNVEAVKKRDLEAVVTASGTIQAKRFVNMSAVQMGRVTRLAVEEGDRVKAGQFLLESDPNALRGTVERGQAAVAAARAGLEQSKVNVETARANLTLARDQVKRQRDLWAQQLTTRENLDKAESELKVRETELAARQSEVGSREQMIKQEAASLDTSRYNLRQVTLVAPFDGIVTRRNIEEGENVVVGTMNNAGTQLLTVADMSIIEAEVEVDETDIPSVRIGQVAKITIDALPDQTFTGKVTEIGNSPIQQATAAATAGQQATNFKVTVQLDRQIPEARPGFTCSASITTATRQKVLSVPIQAMAAREVVLDAKGQIIREPRDPKDKRRRRPASDAAQAAPAPELKPGQTRKEIEGVFVFKNNESTFMPVRVGIAGDKYFEVVTGLKDGEQVITGPFNSVRNLKDGDEVKVGPPPGAPKP
jgi:HlyD family secretion protein